MVAVLAHPYLAGCAVLAAVYLICGIQCGWNPWKLIEGFDGSTSTSKAQFFFWTLAGLFGYVAFFTAWLHQRLTHPAGSIPDFPPMASWLASAMGLSGATAITAKGITSGYVASGRLVKTIAGGSGGAKGGLLVDDTGFPELVKIQLIAWTGIAIGVFLAKLAVQIHQQDFAAFPEVDGTLLALLGIGQGTYVGKKLASVGDSSANPQPAASSLPPVD